MRDLKEIKGILTDPMIIIRTLLSHITKVKVNNHRDKGRIRDKLLLTKRHLITTILDKVPVADPIRRQIIPINSPNIINNVDHHPDRLIM